MSNAANALSFSICAAVSKPSGITVPMSALTATRERSDAAGASAAVKVTGAAEPPQAVAT